ncbi:ImmA/IrrE family metallo-endopeptidase [Brevibacillus brevis X23]|nr:ImmA/IrrE family metallo-endopeptidase [Brevibacillus brevis X23]
MATVQRENISAIADMILKATELKSPLDLERLVEFLGGRVIYRTDLPGNMEAMISKKNESFEIIIKDDKPSVRQRFSIAHELGHLFLHMGYLIDPDKWQRVGDYQDSVYYRYGYSTEEYEANEFAAALLMPRDEFIKIAEKNLDQNGYYVTPIAQHFNVSTNAVVNRGKWLGLFQ